jgi:hypothetical protein
VRAGGGQISGSAAFQRPAPQPFAGFFPLSAHFERSPTDYFVTSDLKIKKTFDASNTYKVGLLGKASGATNNSVFIFSERQPA